LLALAAIWPAARAFSRASILLAILGSLSLAWYSDLRWSNPTLAKSTLQIFAEFPQRSRFAGDWLAGRQTLLQNYEEQLSPLRKITLPPLQGSVDIHPRDQRLLIAQDLDFRPRPVIQSYLAYTDKLAQLNADFLASPAAPDNILFDLRPVDDQYPSQADGLCWPQLLSLYDLKNASFEWLHLQKAPIPRTYNLSPLQQTTAPLGQWLPVPASPDPIWLSIQLHPNLAGRAWAFLYKPPQLQIGIKNLAGSAEYFRLLPDRTQAGFLLSPLISSQTDFAFLGSSQWQDQLHDQFVTEICIRVDPQSFPPGGYDDACQLQFSALHFQHADISSVPGVADFLAGLNFSRQIRVVYADLPPKLIALGAGRMALLAPAASDLFLAAPPHCKSVHITFGMLDASFSGQTKTDGVDFRVYAITGINGKSFTGSQIWSRTLDPAQTPADRGPQEADIPISAPALQGLLLKCVPGPRHLASYSYWSAVHFR
jgi:hypothetical protein